MNRRILTVVGTLALLAWTVGGLLAWRLTGEGVQITLQDQGAVDQKDEALRLLEDRVGSLENDVRSLASTLGTNFQRLQDYAKQDGDERVQSIEAGVGELLAAQSQAIEDSFAADRDARREEVQAQAAREADATSRLLAAMDDLTTAQHEAAQHEAAQLAAARAAPAPAAPAAPASATASAPAIAAPDTLPPTATLPPPAVKPTADSSATSSLPTASPPVPPAPVTVRPHAAPVAAGGTSSPRTAPSAAPENGKQGFLSFQLPSQTVTFAGRRHWRIVPSLSRVGFDGSSTLHRFTGVTSSISGSLDVDLSRPVQDPRAEIHVQAATLDTGDAARDAQMRYTLGTASRPDMSFRLVSFQPQTVDAHSQRITGVCHGVMTIRGTSREVDMPTTLALDASRRLHVDGQMPLDMVAYGVRPPSKLGIIKTNRMVRVWIRLLARAQEGQ